MQAKDNQLRMCLPLAISSSLRGIDEQAAVDSIRATIKKMDMPLHLSAVLWKKMRWPCALNGQRFDVALNAVERRWGNISRGARAVGVRLQVGNADCSLVDEGSPVLLESLLLSKLSFPGHWLALLCRPAGFDCSELHN